MPSRVVALVGNAHVRVMIAVLCQRASCADGPEHIGAKGAQSGVGQAELVSVFVEDDSGGEFCPWQSANRNIECARRRGFGNAANSRDASPSTGWVHIRKHDVYAFVDIEIYARRSGCGYGVIHELPYIRAAVCAAQREWTKDVPRCGGDAVGCLLPIAGEGGSR